MDNTHSKCKTALITGASSGIGAATAIALAHAGYRTIITCDRDKAGLFRVHDEIVGTIGLPCETFLCDCSKLECVERMFKSSLLLREHNYTVPESVAEPTFASTNLPTLDLLVNNAGIAYYGLLQDMNDADWCNVISTNLSSVFYTCKCAIPLMLQAGGGSIINVSSIWGNVGASMEVAYSASKGGVNALTKALAKELAPSDIAVNAVAPGVIDTRMNDHLTDEDIYALTESIPMNRLGSPQEVAQTIVMLAQSPHYLTGQIVEVAGAW